MKKLDKLVLMSFWGPFLITMSVIIFIFLMRIIIFYVDEFVSKDVELWDYVRLFSYFSLITVPTALPLSVLLASLMSFGNLGEYFELTAIKSAGISMIRVMLPLFIAVMGICVFSFYFSDKIAPWANLKGYSLLYDIKTTKATLKIKEGIFYNDLPGYSIKVDEKMPDGQTMKGMVIYRHEQNYTNRGNTQVILADSGRMYPIHDNNYLVIELFNGIQYDESQGEASPRSAAVQDANAQKNAGNFTRSGFQHYKMVESLSSFGMRKTDEEQFKYHAFMNDLSSLNEKADSIQRVYVATIDQNINTSRQYFTYAYKPDYGEPKKIVPGNWIDSTLNVPVSDSLQKEILTAAKSAASNMESFASGREANLKSMEKSRNEYTLESHHKFTQALSCIIMFLIGAPLGAIIKKGGFGVPVLISIVFYILMYVLITQGNKWVTEGLVPVYIGAWMSNSILLLFGLYFIDRAKNDSRLFDKDIYTIFVDKLKRRISERKAKKIIVD